MFFSEVAMDKHSQADTREAERSADSLMALIPTVDIIEDEAGFTLTADLPGVSKDRLGIKVNGDNLLIEGEVATPVPQGMELLYAEMRTPHYRRSFTLSRELDASKIEAKLNDGVLKLRIPKAEQAKPRRIEIRVG
jgi:HSP20 family molecular chaperone IbpA